MKRPRKTSAGPEAAKQLYCDIKSFNDKVDHVFRQLGRDDGDPMKRRRYHLVPKLPTKEFVRDSGDARVLLLLTKHTQTEKTQRAFGVLPWQLQKAYIRNCLPFLLHPRPMEKKKGQKTGKRLRGTQVVCTQDRLQSHSPCHGLAMTK